MRSKLNTDDPSEDIRIKTSNHRRIFDKQGLIRSGHIYFLDNNLCDRFKHNPFALESVTIGETKLHNKPIFDEFITTPIIDNKECPTWLLIRLKFIKLLNLDTKNPFHYELVSKFLSQVNISKLILQFQAYLQDTCSIYLKHRGNTLIHCFAMDDTIYVSIANTIDVSSEDSFNKSYQGHYRVIFRFNYECMDFAVDKQYYDRTTSEKITKSPITIVKPQNQQSFEPIDYLIYNKPEQCYLDFAEYNCIKAKISLNTKSGAQSNYNFCSTIAMTTSVFLFVESYLKKFDTKFLDFLLSNLKAYLNKFRNPRLHNAFLTEIEHYASYVDNILTCYQQSLTLDTPEAIDECFKILLHTLENRKPTPHPFKFIDLFIQNDLEADLFDIIFILRDSLIAKLVEMQAVEQYVMFDLPAKAAKSTSAQDISLFTKPIQQSEDFDKEKLKALKSSWV